MRKTVLTILAFIAFGSAIYAQSDTLDLGYGISVSKAESSIAADAVNNGNIATSGTFNVMNNLYGLIPGLQVTQGENTSWNNGPSYYVRGTGSFNGNSVIVFVDGIERSPDYINVEEVENITVLKDAAAIALYGNRGADGVILITTKRGKNKSGLSLKANYTMGVQTPFRIPKMATSSEYTAAVNEALANDGLDARYTGSLEVPSVDWRKQVLRGAGMDHDLNLSIDGADSKAKYFIYANYHGNNGLLNYSEMSSLKIRANLDIQMTPTTLVKLNMSGRIMQHNNPIAGTSLSSMYNTPSAAFPITKDGYWVRSTNFSNPLAEQQADGYTVTLQRALFADLSIDQKLDALVDGLGVEARIAYDNSADIADTRQMSYQYYNYDYNGTYTSYGTDSQMTFSTYLSTQFMRYTIWGKVYYNHSWGDHNLNAAFIYDESKIKYRGANNFSANRDFILNGIYNYAGKYFATATLNYSGSARLQSKHKYRLYPAVSAAWLLSKEDWFNAPAALNSLKLRASFGLTGFDGRLSYDMDKQFNGGGGSYVFFGTTTDSGLAQGDLPSSYIQPEIESKADIGIEAILLDNLFVQFDGFYNHRKNIMTDASGKYSSVIGLGLPTIFDGEVINKGVEFAANYHKNVGDFNYKAGVNLSYTKDKIKARTEEYTPYSYMSSIGRAIDSFYALTADGFYTESDFNADGSLKEGVPESTLVASVQPGDVKYKDLNGDGRIDSYDYSYTNNGSLGNFYYGITLGASYKNFGFEAIFNGVAGRYVYTNLDSIFQPLYNDAHNISQYYLSNYWNSTNTNAKYPRLTTLSNNNNFANSTLWMEKGGFFKLRNLYVYYDINPNLVKRLKMSSCRVFFRGNNLFSIDSIKILDPEYVSVGYPSLRTFQLGLKCAF